MTAAPAMLLQRQRVDGDAGRWRTVLTLRRSDALAEASRLVAIAEQIDDRLRWRLVTDAAGGEAYYWVGGRWCRAA